MLSSIGKLLGSRTGLDEDNDSLGTTGGPASEASEVLINEFFTAIHEQDTEAVRRLLVDHKSDLTRARFKPEPRTVRFPDEVERDAYTLLGAYLGPLTGLQYSILTGRDAIARDILDSTFEQDVDARFGSGNTALHLAVLLGASAMVSDLIERGADVALKNKRGYSAVDMSDNPDILKLLQSGGDEDTQ
ncbi:hypothetical protein EC957_008693 [Mortierella hygrophila]|uniref:Ankyrin repeat domain-containing protein n=1 Tax=Mortierella hygrophila TaxID=979708 RepID=A0A9P6EXD3_9FUNG|nr:hypothetical protein EC957_008693 [Mortierella hygrophila]